MKQNLSEAKTAAVIVALMIALVTCGVGCARRTRLYAQPQAPAAIADNARLDINTASTQDLERLPGIGRVIAERIVEHRIEHGPFRRVEHVMMVRGISERKFRAMEALITVQHTP